jgi:LuxR family maltose regulon positive regulatory protein
VQVRQRLALGEAEAALRLAGSLAEKVQSAPIMARTGAALILARARLAAGRTAEAFATLEECAATLEAHAHWGALIEALVVRAATLTTLDQPDRARADLRRALTLAAPEGYVRVFVDEGQAVRRLLLKLKDRLEPQTDEQLIRYVAGLLAAFSPDDDDLESRLPQAANEALIEPLTDRELEVLRLMADGLTNSEIAAKLIVAESTVKKHINHLFDKLNAQTRVQAINTARHLELI